MGSRKICRWWLLGGWGKDEDYGWFERLFLTKYRYFTCPFINKSPSYHHQHRSCALTYLISRFWVAGRGCFVFSSWDLRLTLIDSTKTLLDFELLSVNIWLSFSDPIFIAKKVARNGLGQFLRRSNPPTNFHSLFWLFSHLKSLEIESKNFGLSVSMVKF